MIAMRMMQTAVHKVIHVIAVRHLRMSTVGPVLVFFTLNRVAFIRIGFTDFNDMLVNMTIMRVMQMAVVKVINVTLVFNLRMAAIGAMLVGMIFMDFTFVAHD